MLFIRTKHNLQILGLKLIPFMKLQNGTGRVELNETAELCYRTSCAQSMVEPAACMEAGPA